MKTLDYKPDFRRRLTWPSRNTNKESSMKLKQRITPALVAIVMGACVAPLALAAGGGGGGGGGGAGSGGSGGGSGSAGVGAAAGANGNGAGATSGSNASANARGTDTTATTPATPATPATPSSQRPASRRCAPGACSPCAGSCRGCRRCRGWSCPWPARRALPPRAASGRLSGAWPAGTPGTPGGSTAAAAWSRQPARAQVARQQPRCRR
jgi:hypothetical protein